ncbi:MAG: CaiB/BaiF CoA transferase family protein [Planctomycetota bacterium]
MTDAPLAGLKVIELASVLAGPAVGAFLAELGADVTKVENPHTGGDVTRGWKLAGEAADDGISAYFAAVNAGKRSIRADLQTAAGCDTVRAMIDTADVVIASYKPGDAARLGMDAATLQAHNARLIVAEITSFGESDARPGYDAIVQAETGFTSMNGHKLPVALIDVLAAHQLKEAILLALWQRERDGLGRRVTVSLFDAGVASLANQATNWLVGGVVAQPMRDEHPNIVPYGTIFDCICGGRVVIACGSDAHFVSLCRALGTAASRLPEDPRFATNAARVAHRDELLPMLRDLFGTHEAASLMRALQAAKVPVGEVRDVGGVFGLPAAEALTITHRMRDGRELRTVRQAVWRDGGALPGQPVLPPPRCGEHDGPSGS